MPPELPSAPPSTLGTILEDFRAAGIRPTPLAVISTATDRGLSDVEMSSLVDELATSRGLDEIRA